MMTPIDDRIRGALDADDRAFLAGIEEDRGLFRQMGAAMTGPLGGWAKVVFAAMLVMALALFYAVWQVFAAPSADERILWAIAALAVLMAQGFAKEWFFSRMNMLAILRELKRLQFQVAVLREGEPGAR
jgi:hypothetical protein